MVRDPLQDLDLSLLITLEALLRHGSVTRAAQELDVTQSAVSHSLRKLRLLFSDPLFLKGRSGVVPTERAKALGDPVRRILGIARQSLFGDTIFSPAVAERTVTICTSDMGEISLLPLLVERLRVAAPLCTLRTVGLNMADIARGLGTGELDLVLSGPLKLQGAILQQRIYTHSFSVIVSPDSKAQAPLTLRRYQEMDHISIAPAFSSRSQGDLAWHSLNVAPNVYLTTPHMTAVPWIVARSPDLVATVPTQLAETFTALGVVRTVETAFQLPSLPVYQYWHRRFAEDRFGAWFRAFVRDTVSSHPELNVSA